MVNKRKKNSSFHLFFNIYIYQKVEVKPKEDLGCGSCYGAAVNETQCCQTCQDVIDAYHQHKWSAQPKLFDQCKNEITERGTHELNDWGPVEMHDSYPINSNDE